MNLPKKKNKHTYLILHILGLISCILPPAAATLSYFPLWKSDGGGKTLAGGAVLLLIMSAYPLIKWIKRHISEISSYMLWLILFLLFFTLSKIAAEMTVICFAGFIGNSIGAVLFYLSKRSRSK